MLLGLQVYGCLFYTTSSNSFTFMSCHFIDFHDALLVIDLMQVAQGECVFLLMAKCKRSDNRNHRRCALLFLDSKTT